MSARRGIHIAPSAILVTTAVHIASNSPTAVAIHILLQRAWSRTVKITSCCVDIIHKRIPTTSCSNAEFRAGCGDPHPAATKAHCEQHCCLPALLASATFVLQLLAVSLKCGATCITNIISHLFLLSISGSYLDFRLGINWHWVARIEKNMCRGTLILISLIVPPSPSNNVRGNNLENYPLKQRSGDQLMRHATA